jgi:hydroxyethylthiazole kinase-like uncharacterized protein yjeF
MPDAPGEEGAGDRVPRVVTPALLRDWPLPGPEGSKESKGRLLVLGGSVRTPGAVLLAAEAALRVGAGKVQVATTAATAVALATAVPEAFVVGLREDADGEIARSSVEEVLELAGEADAVLVGPGIGAPTAARALLEAVVPRLTAPLVVDALGTAYLTAHPDGVRHLRGRVVLTPNAHELGQVLHAEDDPEEGEVLRATHEAVRLTGVTVLSGADVSYVVDADGSAWCVEAAAPGAAAAGSGDVKAGAVAGLLARGAFPAQAGVWGAYLHGRAGERLTATVGRVGFLARELAAELPHALAEVEG